VSGFTDFEDVHDPDSKEGDCKAQAIQKIIHEVLGSLNDAESEGINLICADGQQRLCHPILCQYIADYQDQVLAASIVNNYCPRCEIHRYSWEDD